MFPNMEWIISILIVAPAIWLARLRSNWLLDYAIIVFAFNRGIRRIADYYVSGQFNPFSPISLTPLVVAAFLLIPAATRFSQLSPRTRTPFFLLGAALTLGFAVGIVFNRLAAIYSLAEWISGFSVMAFAATELVGPAVADRWIKTAGWCAVLVALYGWWQYYTIPPWDAMWLIQSGMVGYMGRPEPTLMTVFSTLNERGPCGTFLAWAAIPMIINPRWRIIGGWPAVALLLSGIVLTQTRGNLIIIAIVALLYPALTRGRGIGQLLLLAALFTTAMTWGLQRIPGMEQMGTRFGSESLYGEGSSLQGRIEIYRYSFADVLTQPLGLGLGCSGMGRRTEGETLQSVGDAGYLQIFAQFGWLGAIFFFAALWLLWGETGWRWRAGCQLLGAQHVDPFVPATRAILLASLVFLFVGDIFSGFSLVWVFFGRALSLYADPAVTLKLREILARRSRALAPEAPIPAVDF